MKIGYIILAHKNPDQLKRLVWSLMEPWTSFYIHIDKNTDIEPFKSHFSHNTQIVFLDSSDREAGTWGDIGIVRGTLNAMKKGLEKEKPDIFILLSGQDYPLRNNQKIYDFFKINTGINFIDLNSIPFEKWEKGGLNRINKYKINKSSNRGHFTLLPSIFDKNFYSVQTLGKINYLRKSKKYNDLLKIFKKRKFPKYLKPYGGSVYFALPLNTVERIVAFIDNNLDYLKYHHYTLSADEIFFHSIIGYLKAKNNLTIKPTLTYVNWQKKNAPPPVTFKTEDFEELKLASKHFLFARKFDIHLDQEILDKCDNELLKE